MKKTALAVTLFGFLIFLGFGSAHADYSFSFGGSAQAANGNTYTYDFSGTLTSATNTPDSNGYVIVAGGTLTATGTAYNGITFTVAPVPGSPAGTLNGYPYYDGVQNTNGDDIFYDNIIAPGVNPVLPAVQAGLLLEGVYNGRNITLGLSSGGANQYAIFCDNTNISDPYVIGWGWTTLADSTASATPTPVPAAAWIFGSGLACLGFVKRRIFKA